MHGNGGFDVEATLANFQTSKAAERAHAATGERIRPTPEDWIQLAKQLPLLRTVLAGKSLGQSGNRRQRRVSLVGSILNRRPLWAAESIAEIFRPSLEAYDGVKQSDPVKVAELLQEVLECCDGFERGAGRAFKMDELRIASRQAARRGESDTQAALDALIDAEPGRTLYPMTDPMGNSVGKFLAKQYPRRSIRALYDTLTLKIGDLHSPFSKAALESWDAQRGDFEQLVTIELTDTGKPKNTEPNAIQALFELGFPLAFDERRQCIMVRGPLPWDPNPVDRPIADDDYGQLARYISSTFSLHAGTHHWATAISTYAAQQSFDSVVDYLRALPPWDGKIRWLSMLTDIAGLKRGLHVIHNVCVTRWAIGCIARAMEPGCKNDTMLVLIGDQGLRKTSFGRALVGEKRWFLESYGAQPHDKDATMILHSGAWIIEYGELAGLRTAQIEQVKAFLSASDDTFRRPYGRTTISLPRRSAALGTANDRGSGLFRDPTGSRRFWPIPVDNAIDLAPIVAIRDQLWAEALQYYRDGIQWWLTPEEQAQLESVSEPYQLHDALGPDIYAYLVQRQKAVTGDEGVFVTTREVLAATGHLRPFKRGDQMRVAEALKRIGGRHAQRGKYRERGYLFEKDRFRERD